MAGKGRNQRHSLRLSKKLSKGRKLGTKQYPPPPHQRLSTRKRETEWLACGNLGKKKSSPESELEAERSIASNTTCDLISLNRATDAVGMSQIDLCISKSSPQPQLCSVVYNNGTFGIFNIYRSNHLEDLENSLLYQTASNGNMTKEQDSGEDCGVDNNSKETQHDRLGQEDSLHVMFMEAGDYDSNSSQEGDVENIDRNASEGSGKWFGYQVTKDTVRQTGKARELGLQVAEHTHQLADTTEMKVYPVNPSRLAKELPCSLRQSVENGSLVILGQKPVIIGQGIAEDRDPYGEVSENVCEVKSCMVRVDYKKGFQQSKRNGNPSTNENLVAAKKFKKHSRKHVAFVVSKGIGRQTLLKAFKGTKPCPKIFSSYVNLGCKCDMEGFLDCPLKEKESTVTKVRSCILKETRDLIMSVNHEEEMQTKLLRCLPKYSGSQSTHKMLRYDYKKLVKDSVVGSSREKNIGMNEDVTECSRVQFYPFGFHGFERADNGKGVLEKSNFSTRLDGVPVIANGGGLSEDAREMEARVKYQRFLDSVVSHLAKEGISCSKCQNTIDRQSVESRLRNGKWKHF